MSCLQPTSFHCLYFSPPLQSRPSPAPALHLSILSVLPRPVFCPAGGSRNPKDQQYMKMTLNQMLVELDGFKPSEGALPFALR